MGRVIWRPVLGFLLLAVAGSVAGLDGTGPDAAGSARPGFADLSMSAGLDFVHFNGMSGEFYYPEVVGGGGALFDMDNDGDLDLYLVQGTMLGPGKTLEQSRFPPRHAVLTDRLYRNDLTLDAEGRRLLRFTDVTAEAGLAATREYGMGVASGDYDGDGDVDLYVTGLRDNRLLRNRGDGRFEDVTAAAGAVERRWTVAASFLDFDRDGYLDLFLANYLHFDFANHKVCLDATGTQDYCGPQNYPPLPDRLLRNRGDGTFEDVTARVGLDAASGAALGAVARDFDDDGWLDLYVANDLMPNQLWMNRGRGGSAMRQFEDESLLAGAAVNGEGKAEASMGIAAADADGDGDEDLLLAHLDGETNTLYLNDGTGLFDDRSQASGLGNASWNYTAFGAGFFDVDNDGDLDFFAANGAVKTLPELVRRGDPYPLHQRNQLFENQGGGRFVELVDAGLDTSEVSRAAIFGDVDNDGDTDIVVVNNGGPVRLLQNRLAPLGNWLGLRLLTPANPRPESPLRDALGAKVTLVRQGAPDMVRRVATDGSYAAASDPRVLFGLRGSPEAAKVTAVRVRWPSGREEVFPAPPSGVYTALVEGHGQPAVAEVAATVEDDSP